MLRAVHNRAQATTSNREDRWRNVSGIFAVRHPERIAGRHLLLVDDVLTTGATLVACAEAIQRAVPSCRISIATLSVSAYELFGGRGKGGL
ncbi:MAG: phosphoribosyltransferase family protein [Alistipes sp.]|nr:phosphoribosyltransferase family protein [Alistipes sp.]